MTFGEVVHYVTQPTGWPEPVRGITSLLSPFHCPDSSSDVSEHLSSASSSNFSEPLVFHGALAPESYTAKDFQILIQSTAAGLSALAELPHYGGERSTVPLWSQLLHALSNTLSPDVMILEDASFIMPRAQNVASQPLNLIDGRATLLAAHAIFSAPRTHSDTSRTSSRNEEDEDESMHSADSDSSDGSVESLDLPLQAHMLSGRGRRLSAVVPVLLVADSYNIVPLMCSTLYQRRVWGIRQPVVGLCCSSTGTIATAIFGWLDPDQSEEGHMATHLALAADIGLDSSMGVFDFTDTCSAINLAQFILGLRTHFEDIKGSISIEAVDSLTPLHWRSDLPDFETQSGGPLDERVASWTHQVHVETSSSEASSSSSPRTPPLLSDTALVSYETISSPLLATIVEDEQVHGANIRAPQEARAINVKGRGPQPSSSKRSSKRTSPGPRSLSEFRTSTSSRAPSPYPNSQFAALSDTGLDDSMTLSNWLFERNAFAIGRIPVRSEELAKKTGINTMVELYDKMTEFSWSDDIRTILSNVKVDRFVSGMRTDLCTMNRGPNCQSTPNDVPSLEDVEFISSKFSVLLHAVTSARQCDDIAKLQGANEADRRHEWDALLLNFFQPVPSQRDVLLERQLNLACNNAADDASFASRANKVILEYRSLCLEQEECIPLTRETAGSWEQAAAAVNQALQFSYDIRHRLLMGNFAEVIADHSSKDPVTGKCDAILVVPCSGVATTTLQRISSVEEKDTFLKSFMLVQGPKPDTSTGETPHQIETPDGHPRKTTSGRSLQVPSSSRVSESKKLNRNHLHNPFLHHPDRNQVTQTQEAILSKDAPCDEPSQQNLLLPVLLAEYKKKDESAISTSMNQMKTYLVSAVTFLSKLGIIDKPVFGLIVNGTLGAVTMAWMTNKQIYVMERNIRYYDIRDPLQALQFVSILPRLARHGLDLRGLLRKQLAIIDVTELQSKPWSKLAQQQEDKRLAAAQQTRSEEVVAQDRGSDDAEPERI
ncbi:hypothetical protein BDR07DRAFT_1611788 [Suillus spraguei]|nr:hypothetical protein BDR07DRAFT_1611788 [Suillus spraguei]